MTTKRKQRLHAQKLVAKLVDAGQIELADGADRDGLVEAVVVALAELVSDEERSRGWALGSVLEESRAVAEVFVDNDELDGVVEHWIRSVYGTAPVISDDRNPEIEAKLLADPDDELASVYADWLIERGNPLGELFACATDPVARKRLFTKHAAALWGAYAEYEKLLDITWTRLGASAIAVAMQRTSTVELEWGRMIAAVLDRPFAMFCRSLSIGPLPDRAHSQLETLLAAIGERPAIRELAVLAPTQGGYLSSNVDVSQLAALFPHLAKLRVESYLLAGAPLRHPTLEELDLYVYSTAALQRALTDAELPNIRRLAVGATASIEPSPLARIPEEPWFAQLDQLDLRRLGTTAANRVVQVYRAHLEHIEVIR